MDDCNKEIIKELIELERVQIPLWTIVTVQELHLRPSQKHVQIPLWTIVTALTAFRFLALAGSDSSMDDCNAGLFHPNCRHA